MTRYNDHYFYHYFYRHFLSLMVKRTVFFILCIENYLSDSKFANYEFLISQLLYRRYYIHLVISIYRYRVDSMQSIENEKKFEVYFWDFKLYLRFHWEKKISNQCLTSPGPKSYEISLKKSTRNLLKIHNLFTMTRCKEDLIKSYFLDLQKIIYQNLFCRLHKIFHEISKKILWIYCNLPNTGHFKKKSLNLNFLTKNKDFLNFLFLINFFVLFSFRISLLIIDNFIKSLWKFWK